MGPVFVYLATIWRLLCAYYDCGLISFEKAGVVCLSRAVWHGWMQWRELIDIIFLSTVTIARLVRRSLVGKRASGCFEKALMVGKRTTVGVIWC